MKPLPPLALFVLTSPALAQSTWTGGTDTDWDEPTNWSTGAVPGPADEVIVGVGSFAPTIAGLDKSIAKLTVQNGATVTLAGADLLVGGRVDLDGVVTSALVGDRVVLTGDLDVGASGSWTALEPIGLDGTGHLTIHGAAPGKPAIEVLSGTRTLNSCTVAALTLTGGTLHLGDARTLTVSGDAKLDGGTLSFDTTIGNNDTLDVLGSLIQTGTAIGSTSAQTRIFVDGDWYADTPFTLANGWVYLEAGDSDIGGAAPAFHRVQLSAGVNTLLTDVVITGELKTVTGTTAGSGWLDFQGSVSPHQGNNDVLNRVRVTSGTNEFRTTICNELEITGGTLHLRDASTFSVNQDARLIGGTLAFDTTVGNHDTLDVAGSLIQTGTTVGSTSPQTRIYVAGDWLADTPFVLDSGWVHLDGGDSDIGGADPRFRRLWLQTGVNTLLTDVDIDGTLRTTTGTSVGAGWFELSQTLEPVQALNDRLERVRVVGPGTAEFVTSLVGFLEVTGGTLHIRDAVTLSVTDDAAFTGGAVSFDNLVGNFDVIDVAGDVTAIGGAVSQSSTFARLRVAGDWTGSGSFVLPSGWVELDGAGATTIGGPAPTFGDLRIAGGTRTLVAPTATTRDLEVEINATLDVAAQTLSVAGSLDSSPSNAVIQGTAPIQLTGTGDLRTHTEIPAVHVTGGTRTGWTSTLAALELVSGELHVRDNATVTVTGDATFTGGTLSFDTTIGNWDRLDVEGAVIQTGTVIGSTSDQTHLYCAGDWLADAPFELPSGWVHLDGSGVIGGLAPSFKRLDLDAGVRDVQTKATVSGTITSTGGTTTGAEWLELIGSTQAVQTGSHEIGKLRVAAGYVPFLTSTVGDFEMTGGGMLIQDNVTLSATGDFSLLGGTLDFDTLVGNWDTIDIEGDFYQNGGLLGTATAQLRIYCAGDWRSDTGFTLLLGWVYLDGLTDTVIDGVDPSFNSVRITNAKRSALPGVKVRGSLEVLTGATLELIGDLDLGTDLTVTATGASIIGHGIIESTGTGVMNTNSTPIPPVHVTAGLRESKNATVEALVLAGGDVHIRDNSTLHVVGDAIFGAGELSFDTTIGNWDTLDIDGNLSQSTATIGSTTAQSRIYCAGDWLAASPFTLDSGWVYLDGPGVIGGPAPTFKRLQLTSGLRTVQTDAEISGTLRSTGGTTDGGAWLECVDSTTEPVQTTGNLIHRLRVAGGTIPFLNTLVDELELTGGTLHLNDNATLTVQDEARLIGGTLGFDTFVGNWDTLDVQGDLVQTGTVVGTTTSVSRIYVAGNWSADTPFELPNGWVHFDGGDSIIGGAAPAFRRLSLVSGVTSVATEATVSGTITSSGGTTAGPEWLTMIGGTEPLSTGSHLVALLRFQAGTVSSNNVLLGELELTGGTLSINDNATVTVDGDARLISGNLAFNTTVGNFDTLHVNGSLLQTGAVCSASTSVSRIYCAGDWSSNSTFGMASGTVYLDGDGELGGSVPGLDPTFPTLRVTGGTVRTVSSAATLSAGLVDVDLGNRLVIDGGDLTLVGAPVTIDGALSVKAASTLRADGASPITIHGVGKLELVGDAAQPAVLAGVAGDLACTVNGTLAARHFEVRGPAASGLVVSSSASLAAAPDDLRQGLFTEPSAAAGSALLTLDAGGGAVLPELSFTDPGGVGTYNVRRTTGGTVTLANAAGAFAGAAFEDDGSGLVDWTTLTTSTVAGFLAKGGPEEARLSWTSVSEAAGLTGWRIERAASAAGPWSLVTTLAAAGAGDYAYTDLPLAAGVEVHYRLFEEQGAYLGLLGEDACTPWSAAQPANVATVGPGGDYATIQEAVDAASGIGAVISVAAGSYPSFSVLGSAAVDLHVIADGSGPVLVDATTFPVEIALLGFGQTVELVGLDITGGTVAPAVDVHDNLGAVLLDSCTVTGGAGAAGTRLASSFAVSIGRSTLTGSPGLAVDALAKAYLGRGSVDVLDVSTGGSIQLAGVTPGSTNAAPGATVVAHPGVMPDLSCGSFQNLGVPFSLDFEAAPASFYQLATAPGMFPLDLDDPAFWQMLLLVHFNSYAVVNQGFTDPVTGQVNLTVELPADGAFVGAVLPVQGWTISVVPGVQVRFSNMRTVVAMP